MSMTICTSRLFGALGAGFHALLFSSYGALYAKYSVFPFASVCVFKYPL